MYSPITGTGDGSAPVVNITFDYISKDHVKGSVDGVVVELTWTGASQVTFPAAVSSPSTWVVYRETPISIPLVDFANGSVLTEQDLDLANQQLRFHQEEVDGRIDYTNTANEAAIDAAASEAAAATSANQAATSATNANNSEDAAAASQTAAAASQAAAAASAAAASTSETNAAASAASAANSAAVAEAAVIDGSHIDDAIVDTAPGANIVTRSAQKVGQLIAAAVASLTRFALTRAAVASTAATGVPVYLAEGKRKGWFSFDSADHSAHVTADTEQGVYIAPSSDTTGATGAWVRQFTGPLDIRWFGGVADGATDNAPALSGAAKVAALTKGARVLIPWSDSHYRFASTVTVTGGLTLSGEGHSQTPGGGFGNIIGSVLAWDIDVPGLKFFSFTDNDSNNQVTEFDNSMYSVLEDLVLLGGGGTNVNAHGLEMRVSLDVRNVQLWNWAGNGIHIIANTAIGAVPYGNANMAKFDRVMSKLNLLHGVFISGSDTNNIAFVNGDFSNNGGAGVLDKSSLGGNNYLSCQFDSNNASWGTGSAQMTQAQADYPGLSDQATGSIILDNANNAPHVLIGTYVEDTWGKLAHLPVGTIAIGGLLTTQQNNYLTADSRPVILDGYNSTLRVDKIKAANPASGVTVADSQFVWNVDRGWAGVAADARINYSSTGGLMMGGSGTSQDFTLFNKNALTVFYVNTGTRNVNFQGDIALNPAAAKITIGGTQVVTNQQAAVANGVNAVAAPTQAEFNALVTQFNLALAALRAHGLIAP